MRRVKADAFLHAHGRPLKSLAEAHSSQAILPDFGCTYRERLLAVEREIAWMRKGHGWRP